LSWAPDYLEPADLKSYVTIPADDTLDDAQIAWAITSASRAIDKATRRQFGKVSTTEARYYTPEWDKASGRYVLRVDDIHTASGLLVAIDTDEDQTWSTSWTGAVYKWPLNAAAEGRPFERLGLPASAACPLVEGSVRVTAAYGWAAVPATIEQATALQAARYLKRRDAVFGIAGSPELGSEVRLLDKLDPDVALMVRSYRRSVMG
jgi:hypothetical protein